MNEALLALALLRGEDEAVVAGDCDRVGEAQPEVALQVQDYRRRL